MTTHPHFEWSEIVAAVKAQPYGAPRAVDGVSTDTRNLVAGNLFAALKGPNFDGHDFLARAARAGAVAALVDDARAVERLREQGADPDAFGLLFVEDVLFAYGELARFHRERENPFVFAVTGSSGKTSTKEILSSLLSTKYSIMKTSGNLNNAVGLPRTLLELNSVQYAVVELGMNAPGEIARLARIARPNVGVVINAASAHLEGLGSVEAVARAKGEMFEALSADAVGVFNLDDPLISREITRHSGRAVSFSMSDARADVQLLDSRPSREGWEFDFRAGAETFSAGLPLPGLHNIANCLAALAAAFGAGLSLGSLVEGLSDVKLPDGRLKIIRRGGLTIINDVYNANPASMKAAADVLAGFGPGMIRAAAVGEMRELGVHSARLHYEVGSYFAKSGVDLLFCCGPLAAEFRRGAVEAGMQEGKVFSFAGAEGRDELIRELLQTVKPGTVVLAKGSRAAGMEHVVRALEDKFR